MKIETAVQSIGAPSVGVPRTLPLSCLDNWLPQKEVGKGPLAEEEVNNGWRSNFENELDTDQNLKRVMGLFYAVKRGGGEEGSFRGMWGAFVKCIRYMHTPMSSVLKNLLTAWSATYFSTFYSPNLIHWSDCCVCFWVKLFFSSNAIRAPPVSRAVVFVMILLSLVADAVIYSLMGL